MKRGNLLLAIGALIGIAFAAAGLITESDRAGVDLGAEVAARVNGQVIRRVDYERMVAALAGDKRSPLEEADRVHVLDRLIEEELLVQRALDLGLAYHDSRVRKDLTAALLESIVADSRDLQPGDGELRDFYAEHREFFAGGDQVRVRQVWCRVATLADARDALARATQAIGLLRAGRPLEDVRAELGDPEIVPLPDSLMPVTKLADYLGPSAARATLALQPGEVSEPVRSSSGYHVLQLVERAAAPPPGFDEARTQILEEYRRRAGEQALRTYLDDLRTRADLEIAAGVP